MLRMETTVERPCKKWLDGINGAFGTRVLRFPDAEQQRMYDDRRRWRKVVLYSTADRRSIYQENGD